MALSVIDFFCGAGGFSEGFKQLGYDIVYGYDNWKPAIDTFNHNFNLNCGIKNILDFKYSTEEIDKLPDTDVIIGSPPCVSFSSSNKSGKADKSLGVELTETFLRIVAVKKHQPNSILKAWFMENVVNSKRYLQPEYTFKDLGLTEWAKKNRISSSKVAVVLYENTAIINSADYGSYQARRRLISGEIIKRNKLIIPEPSHSNTDSNKIPYNSINKIKNRFPNPFAEESNIIVKDPQYPIELSLNQIYDHFYDTGIYEVEWRFSRFWKTNHPFMGKMSFPENEDKPSRTITATKIANSRESIIYKSEYERTGDGEYRLPTVREASIFMGFPITYQFLGSENSKWRLVGNAVCCDVSRAFAEKVLYELHIEKPIDLLIESTLKTNNVINLNTFTLKTFSNPPIKNKGSKFRRHPLKDGNLTVTLTNYNIEKKKKRTADKKWYTSIQYGTGEGYPVQIIEDGYYKVIEPIIMKINKGNDFIKIIKDKYANQVAHSSILQEMYEKQQSLLGYKEPTILVDDLVPIIKHLQIEKEMYKQEDNKIFQYKDTIPVAQLFSLYAINYIASKANI